MLYGRAEESVQVERMLARARKGHSSALVLVGESGIGKTALLAHARAKARGFRVLAATGVPSEEGVSFAGLDQLLAPVRDRFDDIPPPQASALRAALDLTSSARVDRDAVLRGTHSTLAAVASERQVICTVDDAHFLDPGSLAALAFASRRLGRERIVMLFARRDVAEVAALDGVPTLELGGLDVPAARELLEAVRPGVVAAEVVERLVAATGGNPLALLQAPALLDDAQLAGRVPLAYPLPVGDEVAQAFASRAAALSPAAQTALVTAAAADTQTLRTLADDGVPGITNRELEECELGELIAIRHGLVVFPHPLARAAFYKPPPPREQREAHRRLAAASKGERRALHLAAAAAGPDEEAAEELERAGLRALRRTGYVTAAGWLSQAADLTPDSGLRARRLALAAGVSCAAGSPGRARAQAATGLELAGDPSVEAALRGVVGVLDAARRGEEQRGPLLADALEHVGLESDAEDEPEALVVHADHLLAASRAPSGLRDAAEAAVAAAREREARWFLPRALVHQARVAIAAGSWSEADADAHEAAALAAELGQVRARAEACVLLAGLEARRGRAAECLSLLDELEDASASRAAVLGLLDLGLGRLTEAIAELTVAQDGPGGGFPVTTLTTEVDLVEALVRTGRQAEAAEAMVGDREFPSWSGALLGADLDAFEDILANPSWQPFERARIELNYGERLRRSGARAEAREHLRVAHELFEQLGAEPWRKRAQDELRATGETARRREPDSLDELTPQELQVLRAIAAGASTRGAAESLFLSPKTVEFHLGKVYRKLGVHSRKELLVALERLGAEGIDITEGG